MQYHDLFFSVGDANIYSLTLLNMKCETREVALNIWQVNAWSGVVPHNTTRR